MPKEVYDPKEHKANDKKVGSKNAKAKEKPKQRKSTPKINKYGFLHLDKDIAEYLGVYKTETPVTIELIENGFTVRLVKA